jgi:pSer/pThr/pTyr-binding forkhead associated (FHA) protein
VAHPVIVIKQEGRKPLHVQVREPLEIGRECDGVILVDGQASRRHALLTPRGDSVLVEDLGSTNGSYVNGRRVEGVAPMGFGDELQIGQVRMRLERALR